MDYRSKKRRRRRGRREGGRGLSGLLQLTLTHTKAHKKQSPLPACLLSPIPRFVCPLLAVCAALSWIKRERKSGGYHVPKGISIAVFSGKSILFAFS